MDNASPKPAPADARDRTLGLVNIWQVARKLWWEVLVFRNIPERINDRDIGKDLFHLRDVRLYAATNIASTCLTLVDWLYYAIATDSVLAASARGVLGKIDMDSGYAFTKSMRELHKPINLCHQISNATKHSHLVKLDENFAVRTMDLVMHHEGGLAELMHVSVIEQNGPDREDGGSVFDALLALADWWVDVLSEIGLPDRELFFPEVDVR